MCYKISVIVPICNAPGYFEKCQKLVQSIIERHRRYFADEYISDKSIDLYCLITNIYLHK